MLDLRERQKTPVDSIAELSTSVSRPLASAVIQRLPLALPGYRLPLARLYERFDAVATGRAPADGVDLHQVILDRLAANRELAEAAGWTACALERDGGFGRLRLIGVAPCGDGRSVVPDWTAGVAADALASAEGARRPVSPDAGPGARPPWPRIVRG